MRAISAIAGGLAGAVAVALIHQILKKLDEEAPHLDALGLTSASDSQNALSTGNTSGSNVSTGLLGNVLYYGMAGYGEKRMDHKEGLMSHAEGIGALYGPKLLGGSEASKGPADKHGKVTAFLHSLGGFVATKVMDFIEDYFEKKKQVKIQSSPNTDYSASGY
ncbi:MAG: hypothetical protein JWQ96_1016 [Segetibacter sp.]|nr:hypothetical protein [Segetibacter sp.]